MGLDTSSKVMSLIREVLTPIPEYTTEDRGLRYPLSSLPIKENPICDINVAKYPKRYYNVSNVETRR